MRAITYQQRHTYVILLPVAPYLAWSMGPSPPPSPLTCECNLLLRTTTIYYLTNSNTYATLSCPVQVQSHYPVLGVSPAGVAIKYGLGWSIVFFCLFGPRSVASG